MFLIIPIFRTYSQILLQLMKKLLYSEHVRFYIIAYTIMKHLTQAEFSSSIASGISVVDFFATRCGPCQMIAPYLEQMDTQPR